VLTFVACGPPLVFLAAAANDPWYSSMQTNWHVATAAEAIAAAQFARFGYDVSVQYGANQPEYDLMIAAHDGTVLKVSVKGSKTGGWGLTQSHLRETNYGRAADEWAASHRPGTAVCLVQFKGVDDDKLPRLYLASPIEIAKQLKAAAGGYGRTVLKEYKVYTSRSRSAGATDEIPATWKMTPERVAQIVTSVGAMARPSSDAHELV